MAYTTIDDAGLFFSPHLHTGNGSELVVSGVGFQPDFAWIKNRTNTDYHVLTDSVRAATKYIKSDDGDAEATDAQGLKSFDSDGYTLGTQNQVNENTANFVGWDWKAGTTTGIGSGDITPTGYSFNTTSGFSIVKYTGTGTNNTLPHGLGIIPKFWAIKNLSQVSDWRCYHVGVDPTDPWDNDMVLNTTVLVNNSVNKWNDTPPTSTVLTLGIDEGCNKSGSTLIAYIWAEVKGFSKFGNYIGNGNADGPFVYTGFRPALTITKSFSANANSWYMLDRRRDNDGFNPANARLEADGTGSENTDAKQIDYLANGFKIRASDGGMNSSGTSYIYMSWAHSPQVNSNNVPTNAR
jgi:hypothetical protein